MKKQQPPYEKLMAYLDGEMTPKARKEFEELLEKHPEWREQVGELAGVVDAAKSLRLRAPGSKTWDNYWQEIDSRLERRLGWTVALIGAVVLILVGFFKVVVYAQNDFVRAGIFLVGAGLTILFVTVLRGRMLELPRDRYKRIRK